jgi:hypothetical protein
MNNDSRGIECYLNAGLKKNIRSLRDRFFLGIIFDYKYVIPPG